MKSAIQPKTTNIQLKEVTRNNWEDIALLTVDDGQKEFIESNAFSLAQSVFEPNWRPFGIYTNNELIGFTMIGKEAKTEHIWLDRFMLDYHYQGKGYGKRSFSLILHWIYETFHCNEIFLSVHYKNNHAKKMYERFGFRLTGKMDGPEIIMVKAS
ncbi:GNAT family N-acetyltransferase [Massilibacterium senegalense]|uniref:GNAT family N-acetyltransferase n=1 Tax=Massilibacterium senegalense TaxID=1632858 RepID=UPI0007841181|nr:GNAT family N-acetyltransferase [Massilibacterium senegalense]